MTEKKGRHNFNDGRQNYYIVKKKKEKKYCFSYYGFLLEMCVSVSVKIEKKKKRKSVKNNKILEKLNNLHNFYARCQMLD